MKLSRKTIVIILFVILPLIGLCIGLLNYASGVRRLREETELKQKEELENPTVISEEVVEEEKETLSEFPEHTISEVKYTSGSVKVKDYNAEGEEYEEKEFTFAYIGNEEIGYFLLPKEFEKISETSYSYKVDNGYDGEVFVAIDGYKKGDYTLKEWVDFIKTAYDGELNFQEESSTNQYYAFTFNPKEDLSAVTFLKISELNGYIHISLVTFDNCDPDTTLQDFGVFSQFDYEPLDFIKMLGEVTFDENNEE